MYVICEVDMTFTQIGVSSVVKRKETEESRGSDLNGLVGDCSRMQNRTKQAFVVQSFFF